MSGFDVTKVFYHPAEAHAINQHSMRDAPSLPLALSIALQNDTV